MDRFQLNIPKMHIRPNSESVTANVMPLLNPGNMGSSHTGFTLSPSSMALARLSYGPCFNRRLFTPSGSGYRPKDLAERRSFGTCDIPVPIPYSNTHLNYMEYGPLHLDLERYNHRYQLNHTVSSASSKSPRSSFSPQPEDLSLATKQSASGSGEEEEVKIDSCDEADDEADDDDNVSDSSKSPAGRLKFSIDAILGSKDSKVKRRSHENYNQTGCSSLAPDISSPGTSPSSHLQARFGGSGMEGCDDDEMLPAKDSEGEDKMMEGMTSEGQRFSWLQCTRYKPPKLPRSKKKDGTKKRKLGRNPRVPFTQHQVNILEQKFRQTHYLSSVDVAELSAALNLTETRVKIWFQNRRARERRDRENIQLLQGGPSSSKVNKSQSGGMDRLSPDMILHQSPGDRHHSDSTSPGMFSPGSRTELTNPGPIGLGLGSIGPSSWPGAMIPKAGVLGSFSNPQQRTSAFTPVNYFSYT